MPRGVLTAAVCLFAFLGKTHGQQVIVGTEHPRATPAPAKKEAVAHPESQTSTLVSAPKAQPVTPSILKTQPAVAPPVKIHQIAAAAPVTKSPAAKPQPIAATPARVVSPPAVPAAAKAPPMVAQTTKTMVAKPGMPQAKNMRLIRVEGPASEPSAQLPLKTKDASLIHIFASSETASTKLADGFDFPVGKPDAQGYYKARGFRAHGHLGEDWDGIRGGDTDLGDPIYSIGDGIVVFARDCHMGWGNVLIVRHTYRENGLVKNVDALYGHLQTMLVRRGQTVNRGEKIATMGNAHGLYDAHLHLEIRKNIEIGMSRAAFAQDSSNYYSPTDFINTHRHIQGAGGSYKVAMNTFVRDARINWAAARNYSHAHSGGGTKESSVALKKAVATAKE